MPEPASLDSECSTFELELLLDIKVVTASKLSEGQIGRSRDHFSRPSQ